MYSLLLVDNEKAVLDGLSHALLWDELGFDTIDLASDGQTAWEMAQKKSYHIIISDIRMTPVDGLELLRNISQSGMNSRVILLTAYDDTDYILRALRLGASNYLMKPIDPHELRNSVIDALKHSARSTLPVAHDEGQSRDYFLRCWLFDGDSCRDLGMRAALNGVNIFLRSYNVLLIKTDRTRGGDIMAAIEQALRPLGEAWILLDKPGEYTLILGGRDTDALSVYVALSQLFPASDRTVRLIIGPKVTSYTEVPSSYQACLAYLDEQPGLTGGLFCVSEETSSEGVSRSASELSYETEHPVSPLVQHTIDHLKERFGAPLSLNQIARDFNVNANYLGFQFHLETGVYFNDYLNSVRIERAQQLLLTTSQSIQSIAIEVGYSSVNYFCHVFKKQTHLSPTQFRERR